MFNGSDAPPSSVGESLVWLDIGRASVTLPASTITQVSPLHELSPDAPRWDLTQLLIGDGVTQPDPGDRFALHTNMLRRRMWLLVGSVVVFERSDQLTHHALSPLIEPICAAIGIVSIVQRGEQLAFAIDPTRLPIEWPEEDAHGAP